MQWNLKRLILSTFYIINNKPYHLKKSGLNLIICRIFLHNFSGLLEGFLDAALAAAYVNVGAGDEPALHLR